MKIIAKSTLMKNHVAGSKVGRQRQLALAFSESRQPILLALDEQFKLRASLPIGEGGTGWNEVNLCNAMASIPGFSKEPVVQTFAVTQRYNGQIGLVLALSESAQSPSRLFISRGLLNCIDAARWEKLPDSLLEYPLPDSISVQHLSTSPASSSNALPLVVITGMKPNGDVTHYEVNPDPEDATWKTRPLILPENANRCLAVAAGRVPELGAGVYSLCGINDSYSLTFTPLPEVYEGHTVTAAPLDLKFPAWLKPRSLAVLATRTGETELYVAGDGLIRFSLQQQLESNLPAEILINQEDDSFNGVSELLVSRLGQFGKIGIWAQSETDDLQYLYGDPDQNEDSYQWSVPVCIATQVTAMSAYQDNVSNSACESTIMAFGKADGSLALMQRDSRSTLWSPRTPIYPKRDQILELTTYTSQFELIDDEGQPLIFKEVQIEADQGCTVKVNGKYINLLAGQTMPVVTDVLGNLTLVHTVESLATPTYRVHCGADTVQVDPADRVRAHIHKLQTATDIQNAIRCDGSPLFNQNKPSDEQANTLVGALNALSKAEADISRQPARSGARSLHRRSLGGLVSSYGVALSDNGAHALVATRGLSDAASNGIEVAAGDLLAMIKAKAKMVSAYFINQLEHAWEFAVKIGKKLLKFVFETASQVLAAIDWALQRTLGISLDDIVSWFGFVFDWDDILVNHKVLKKTINMSLDKLVAEVESTKTTLHEAFNKIRSSLIGNRLIIEQSDAIFQKRLKAPPIGENEEARSPQANWGLQQLTENVDQAQAEELLLDDIGNLFSDITETQLEVIKSALSQIQEQLLNKWNQLTIGEMADLLLQIIGASVINTVENIAMTIVDAIKILVNAVKLILNARWDIPVLTYTYENIICKGDGSRLSLLDLACLLTSIPTTIFYKAITGENVVSKRNADIILAAKDIPGLVDAIAKEDKTRSAMRSTSKSKMKVEEELALTFQCFSVPPRHLAAVLNAAKEYSTGPAKDCFTTMKHSYDWISYCCSSTSQALILSVKDASTRRITDSILLYSQVLMLIKDAFLIGFKLKMKYDVPKPPVAIIDAAFGAGIVVGAMLSLAEQVREEVPSGVDATIYKSVYTLKFTQNIATASYRILALQVFLSDAEPTQKSVKEILRLSRVAILGIRSYLALGRTITMVDQRFVDFE